MKQSKKPLPPAIPLKRRPRLFIALCVLTGVWIAFLMILYFTTVYPLRHPTL